MITTNDKDVLKLFLYRTLPIMVLLIMYFNTYRNRSTIEIILTVSAIIMTWITIIGIVRTKKHPKFKPFIKSFIKSLLFVSFMVIGFKWLGLVGGALGILIGMVLIVAFRIFKSWDFFKESIYRIESMIWGKPLHEYKGKKRPKVKIVWGKK